MPTCRTTIPLRRAARTPRARRAAWLALALASLAGAGPAAAASATYALDPVHTRVMFALSHAGFSQAIGTVSGSTGTLVFDPDGWDGARVEVSVPLTRADLGDAAWNRAALAGDLLDAGKYPVATFVSTRVEPIDARRASVYGTLTLHGVAREVKLDVTLNAAKRYPLPPFRRTAGFSATTTISRKAFGITAWPSVIGDAVELRIEAEASRAKADRGAATAADDAAPDTPPAAEPTADPVPESAPTP
jgi:polyisoprenoid-binding protein YceI